MTKNIYLRIILAISLLGLMSCATHRTTQIDTPSTPQNKITPAVIAHTETPSIVDATWEGNTTTIWDKLQRTHLAKLQSSLTHTSEPQNIGWLNLAIISKQFGANTKILVAQLMTWRKNYPNHPGNSLFPDDTTLFTLLSTPAPKHVALLLPLQGQLGTQGITVRDGFLSAYYESFAKNNPQQTLSFYDTSRNPNVASLYQQALAQGADIVIGPLTKENVQQLSRQNNFPVPIIALNYTDIGLSSLPTNLYQFGLSPRDEALQLADKAREAGRSNAIIIAPRDQWSQRIIKPLMEQWQSKGGTVVETYNYFPRSNLAQDIAKLMHVNTKEDQAQMQEDNDKAILEQQRRQDFDVIFLLAQPQEARVIVPLLKYYYANNIPIYSTSIIYSGAPSPQKDRDLNGVIFCDIPWILNKTAKSRSNRLYAVGRDAQLLSTELPRLTKLPNFPMYAATGALTLNSQQQIYRRVPWTQMHAGRP